MYDNIREPKQKRAVEKKEKLIKAGFQLICENGYFNTNTVEIAKKAGVSTGIVYQYFKDKKDILMAGLYEYGDDLFFPLLALDIDDYDIKNFDKDLKTLINKQINNHKVSQVAHEEITTMIHSDEDVAEYFYQRELALSEKLKNILIKNNYPDDNLSEKVHVMMHLIDSLCHEIIYHQHKKLNYDAMTDIVIKNIKYLFGIDQ